MAQWWGITLALLVLQALVQTSADWTLVVTHSNDLWYQLDEIQGNDTPCYVELPPITEPTTTSTPPTTTTTLTPTTTTTLTPISTTTLTPTNATTLTPTTTTTLTPATETTETTTTPTTETTTITTTTNSTTSEASTIVSTSEHTIRGERSITESSRKVAQQNVRRVRQVQSDSSPNQTTPVNVPYFEPMDNSTSHYFADSINSTVPYFADEVNSTVPYFAALDEKNSTIPYYADKKTPSSFTITTTPNTPKQIECYGGVSRHLTKANEIRKDSESQGNVFLHLNAGGMLGGFIWYPILGTDPAVESIKALNYNAVALGYRDFEEGVPGTVEYLKKLNAANITVLCANMDVTNEPSMKGLFKKSITLNINGKKIGIVGYIGQEADYMADTGKIIFTDPAAAIEDEITKLMSDGTLFIIALGSAGYDGAMSLMSKAFNVDLFVNGGSNTFLYNGDAPLNEKIKGSYPVVDNSQSTKRLLVQTTRYGKYLGNIKLSVSDTGKINSYWSTNPILLNQAVAPDPELQSKVDQWEREVLTKSNETIGFTKTPLVSDKKICWYAECTAAAMMADAARWYLEKTETADETWKKTVAATVWHGGALVDTELDDVPSGPIKFGDILYMFPYSNVLVKVFMYGIQIKTLFENSVEFYNTSTASNLGEFLHVSGMRVEYDLSKGYGSRVANIYIRDTNNIYGGMAPISLDSNYIIGMPSFIANGGSRYAFMEKLPQNSTGIPDEEILKEFIKKFTPLTYGNEGRVKFITSEPPKNCPKTDVTGTVFLTIFLTLLFAGIIFVCYKYLYPKLRDRRGSLMSLVR